MAYSDALEILDAPRRPEETVSNPQNILESLGVFEENVKDYWATYQAAIVPQTPAPEQVERLRLQILRPIANLKEFLQSTLDGDPATKTAEVEACFEQVVRGLHSQVSFVEEGIAHNKPNERKALLGRLDKLSGDLGKVYRGDPVVKGAGLVFKIA